MQPGEFDDKRLTCVNNAQVRKPTVYVLIMFEISSVIVVGLSYKSRNMVDKSKVVAFLDHIVLCILLIAPLVMQ